MRETEFGYLIDDYVEITKVVKTIGNKEHALADEGLGINVDFSKAGLKTIFELIFDLLTKRKMAFVIPGKSVSDMIGAIELEFPGSIDEALDQIDSLNRQ